jgi:hypothetical protein
MKKHKGWAGKENEGRACNTKQRERGKNMKKRAESMRREHKKESREKE